MLKVQPGVHVPDMHIDYPTDDPYVRLYKPVYDREYKVDEHYDFVGDSQKMRYYRPILFLLILYMGLGLQLRLRSGMRYVGRKQLWRHRKQLKGGYISIANHMHPHDCEAVLIGLHARPTVKIPMFQKNFETKVQFFLRLVGGVPIPPQEEGLSAMKQFNLAFDEFHRRGYCFHVFPEMSKWPWYTPIRPFQKGAFTMAYKYGMPIIPAAISYRPRTGIYRLFGPKDEPLITVTYGEPIIPDTTQPRKQEVDRLLVESHAVLCKMAGIDENPWPAQL